MSSFIVTANLENEGAMQLPFCCPSSSGACEGTKFKHVDEVLYHTDIQEVPISDCKMVTLHSKCLTMSSESRFDYLHAIHGISLLTESKTNV